MCESFRYAFYVLGSPGKSSEHFGNVGILLHSNDSELVLLIHPDKEVLSIVVENTSVCRPLTIETTSFEEAVSLLEQKVVSDELLSLLVR